jgi:hypothetical protein
MPGWTWEYVEETVTARRLDAITRAFKPVAVTESKTLDELRSMFPRGIRTNG